MQQAKRDPFRAKRKPDQTGGVFRRSCDPCRLRRLKCVKVDGSSVCQRCAQGSIKCLTSAATPRTIRRHARIEQVKLLYTADEGPIDHSAQSSNSTAHPPQPSSQSGNDLSSFSADTRLVKMMDETFVLARTIRSYSGLRLSKLPLLRWMNVAADFDAAGGRLQDMQPLDQAMFMSIAALVSRAATPEAFTGHPERATKGKDAEHHLFETDTRSEDFANGMLLSAKRKLEEARVFTDPRILSLRSVAALQMVHMLLIVYCEHLEVAEEAEAEARAYANTAALQLRIMAEKADLDGARARTPQRILPAQFIPYANVAWVAVIRDLVTSLAGAAACSFTDDDMSLILDIDPDAPLPSAERIVRSWGNPFRPEGDIPVVWSHVIFSGRTVIRHLTQLSAIRRPRIPVQRLLKVFDTLANVRETLAATRKLAPGGAILEDGPLEPHFQLLGFSSNWIIAQAYRHIAPRLQLDQLQQAAAVKGESYAEYERQLWILLQRAEDEMYEAIHAVVLAFKSVLGRSRRDKTDCMLSGYFLNESVFIWTSLVVAAKVAEDGGRPDYPLSRKLDHLRILRDWTILLDRNTAKMLAHLQRLEREIHELERREAADFAQANDAFRRPWSGVPTDGPSAMLASDQTHLSGAHSPAGGGQPRAEGFRRPNDPSDPPANRGVPLFKSHQGHSQPAFWPAEARIPLQQQNQHRAVPKERDAPSWQAQTEPAAMHGPPFENASGPTASDVTGLLGDVLPIPSEEIYRMLRQSGIDPEAFGILPSR